MALLRAKILPLIRPSHMHSIRSARHQVLQHVQCSSLSSLFHQSDSLYRICCTRPYSDSAWTIRQELHKFVQAAEDSKTIVEKEMKMLRAYYESLQAEGKKAFLTTLATEFGVYQDKVSDLSQAMTEAQGREVGVQIHIEERLRQALVPRYQKVFTRISNMECGVKFLVDIRADILRELAEGPMVAEEDLIHLRVMNSCLRELLSLWFAVGFLNLERVTWHSSCHLMEKISEYEAVHPVRNWLDVKQRVGPYRRCFVFTHNAMPGEPIVVLHTALTDDISSSIQSIVQHPRFKEEGATPGLQSITEDPSTISTAIFYSITSTQKGLQGIEMGNYLIKHVVQRLLLEFPTMHQFSSLSPIPGFRDWLIAEINIYMSYLDGEGELEGELLMNLAEWTSLEEAYQHDHKDTVKALRKDLVTNSWVGDTRLYDLLKKPLMRLCAHYLYHQKRRGYALNPVANFHLRNGAILWRINWMADRSARGLSASCGMMVNYKYELDITEQNSKSYIDKKVITTSHQVTDLLNSK